MTLQRDAKHKMRRERVVLKAWKARREGALSLRSSESTDRLGLRSVARTTCRRPYGISECVIWSCLAIFVRDISRHFWRRGDRKGERKLSPEDYLKGRCFILSCPPTVYFLFGAFWIGRSSWWIRFNLRVSPYALALVFICIFGWIRSRTILSFISSVLMRNDCLSICISWKKTNYLSFIVSIVSVDGKHCNHWWHEKNSYAIYNKHVFSIHLSVELCETV